mgnify:FL=1
MPFQKGNPGRPKGIKNYETLIKEQRRAVFDARVSQKWEETIDKLKPEYVADQFMGKAPDELIVKGAINLDPDIAEKNEITPTPKGNSKGQT